MKQINKKHEAPPMLLGTAAASILGNALTGREVIRAEVTREDEGTIRAGENFNVTLSFN